MRSCMVDYNELYEYLRKEKYGEQLQPLPKQFVHEVSIFFKEQRGHLSGTAELFSDDALRLKKQFENALSLFRELMRLRKRKILNLVFVASETGILKKDFGMMLEFEQHLFEELVKAVEIGDKALALTLNGDSSQIPTTALIIITQPIDAFVDLNGDLVGPFSKGSLVNVDKAVADILSKEGRATLVDSSA